ncbi:MAG: DUF4442 domain-containing protein [Leptospirales bacterium]|nr:DUF4442 domain-containing protein [Leptospirales bacterium]
MDSPEQRTAPLWQATSSLLGFRHALNLYAPYLGAGVSVADYDPHFRWVEVELRDTFFNRNYVGSHFGGSLYAMCDPFYMFLLINRLGKDYIVWDQAARIDFLRPGYGTVRARFEISDGEIEAIRGAVARDRKTQREYEALVLDAEERPVARVWKQLYVRRTPPPRKKKGDAAAL